jgi:hypothetical protein
MFTVSFSQLLVGLRSPNTVGRAAARDIQSMSVLEVLVTVGSGCVGCVYGVVGVQVYIPPGATRSEGQRAEPGRHDDKLPCQHRGPAKNSRARFENKASLSEHRINKDGAPFKVKGTCIWKIV